MSVKSFCAGFVLWGCCIALAILSPGSVSFADASGSGSGMFYVNTAGFLSGCSMLDAFTEGEDSDDNEVDEEIETAEEGFTYTIYGEHNEDGKENSDVNIPATVEPPVSLTADQLPDDDHEKDPPPAVSSYDDQNSSYGDEKRKIVGYFPAWASYRGFTPDKIDAEKLTHINYAFANISSDLKIQMGNPHIDADNFRALNELKEENPQLKTLISVGGWSWSGRFSNAALTEELRKAFAESCLDFILEHGFDGIDLDWEYPVGGGMPGNISRPVDKQNFTLLLKTIRETLDARSEVDGETYLLTIAGGAGSWYVDNTEMDKIHQYLDFANIMTYDINAYWDTYTDFNAPLYSSSSDAPSRVDGSVDDSVNAWLDAGFPAEKLVMGVPFYGYRYTGAANSNDGLYRRFGDGTYISYEDVEAEYLNAPEYVRHFHEEAKVPWLFDGSTFISYDDEESIRLKAEYIKDKNLAGAMIWELSFDPRRVLLNALYEGLQ